MKALLIILLTGFILQSHAQECNQHAHHTAFKAALKPFIEHFTEKSEIAVGMVKGGKNYFSGFRWLDNNIETVENHQTVFELGQMTQVFTTAILGQYVIDGKVNLNDRIRDKVSIELKSKITFGQLASHTSGLDRNPSNLITRNWNSQNPWGEYTEQMLREYFDSKFKKVAKPGEKFFASDLGMALLGFSLKRIEAIEFEELVQKNILDKFGMANTGFNPEKFKENHATPYSGIGKKTDYWTFQRSLIALGGMRSTTEDLCKFMQAFFTPSNEALQFTTQEVAPIKSGVKSAYGWRIWTNFGSQPVIFIKGRTAGFSCTMLISIPKKTGIVLLSNQVLADMEDAMKELAIKYVN